jgi:hypothetical protein
VDKTRRAGGELALGRIEVTGRRGVVAPTAGTRRVVLRRGAARWRAEEGAPAGWEACGEGAACRRAGPRSTALGAPVGGAVLAAREEEGGREKKERERKKKRGKKEKRKEEEKKEKERRKEKRKIEKGRKRNWEKFRKLGKLLGELGEGFCGIFPIPGRRRVFRDGGDGEADRPAGPRRARDSRHGG